MYRDYYCFTFFFLVLFRINTKANFKVSLCFVFIPKKPNKPKISGGWWKGGVTLWRELDDVQVVVFIITKGLTLQPAFLFWQDQTSSHSEELWEKFLLEETALVPQQLSQGNSIISGQIVRQEKKGSWPRTPTGIFLHCHGWTPWVVGYLCAGSKQCMGWKVENLLVEGNLIEKTKCLPAS